MSLPEPPQEHPRGERRELDRDWLAYLQSSGIPAEVARGKIPPLLAFGMAQFNTGHYFESHETWEKLWNQSKYPERLLCLGLTKLGAGFEHVKRGNMNGALTLIHEGFRFLAPFLPVALGVDLARLHRDLTKWLAEAQGGAPPAKFPTIHSFVD